MLYIAMILIFAALALNATASFQATTHQAATYIGLSQMIHQVVTLGLLIYIFILEM